MKSYLTLLVTGVSLFTATQAVVVQMFSGQNCEGTSTERNVWDNTCAYTDGFQSYRVTTYGGNLQQLTAYSRQACSGAQTSQVCAAGVNKVALGQCFNAVNGDGGSNALSSYSSGGICPN